MPVANIKSTWKSGDLVFEKYLATANPQLEFGIDGTGLDVRFFGDTASAAMLWDESEDALTFAGASQLRLGTAGARLTAVDQEFTLQVYTVLTSAKSEGMSAYFDGNIAGTPDGHIYNVGSWINIVASAAPAASKIVAPFEGGIYEASATMTNARIVFGGQHQAIMTNSPDTLYCWRLNTTKTVTAVIAAANSGSVGYAADATTDSSKVGDVPLFDIVGHGVRYVRLYDAAS